MPGQVLEQSAHAPRAHVHLLALIRHSSLMLADAMNKHVVNQHGKATF
jgi:hypothetical protein